MELMQFCRERLAHYKVPRLYVFGPLPKTSTGKIQKFVLRDQANLRASSYSTKRTVTLTGRPAGPSFSFCFLNDATVIPALPVPRRLPLACTGAGCTVVCRQHVAAVAREHWQCSPVCPRRQSGPFPAVCRPDRVAAPRAWYRSHALILPLAAVWAAGSETGQVFPDGQRTGDPLDALADMAGCVAVWHGRDAGADRGQGQGYNAGMMPSRPCRLWRVAPCGPQVVS